MRLAAAVSKDAGAAGVGATTMPYKMRTSRHV